MSDEHSAESDAHTPGAEALADVSPQVRERYGLSAEIDAAIKYVRLQVDGHTIVEFRNGSRACSCGLQRGTTPNLRSVTPPAVPQGDQ